MTNGMYESPKTSLVEESDIQVTLASRWLRLFAALIDGIIMGAVIWPMMFALGIFDGIMEGIEPSIGMTLILGLSGIIFFFLINYYFLASTGQTIGKKIVGIKIVDLDGQLPSFSKAIVPRYLVYLVPGNIPLIGQLFSIVNILFIFGKERRCIHDLVAKTRVVNC